MIREKIIEILCELNEMFEGYNGSDLMEDHILDSFDIMKLIGNIEEIYSIEIDASDIVAKNFKSVDSIFNLVKKYVGDEKGAKL